MKILIFLLLLTTTHSIYSAELKISFTTEGLDLNDAQLKLIMESTNPLCSKIVIGIGGVAIGPTSKYLKGSLSIESDRLIATARYTQGGFCLYKLSEVNLHFIHDKYAYFMTQVSIISKKKWSGGFLDYSELSTNQNSHLEVICIGEGKNSYSMCETLNNAEPNGRGNIGKLYIWAENLREIDAYHGGKLTYKMKR